MRDIVTTECESKLIQRCAEGDHDSFKGLYDLYKDRVYSTSVRMLGNLQDTEDAFQETFIKIFKSINNFKWKSSFSTWVYKITVNTCIENLRTRKKENNVNIDEVRIMPSNKTSEDFRLIVEKAIKKLPEGYRTIFILHAIEGFKHREIAEILDISPGTSKSQYFQARAHLRKNLLPYLEVLKHEL